MSDVSTTLRASPRPRSLAPFLLALFTLAILACAPGSQDQRRLAAAIKNDDIGAVADILVATEAKSTGLNYGPGSLLEALRIRGRPDAILAALRHGSGLGPGEVDFLIAGIASPQDGLLPQCLQAASGSEDLKAQLAYLKSQGLGYAELGPGLVDYAALVDKAGGLAALQAVMGFNPRFYLVGARESGAEVLSAFPGLPFDEDCLLAIAESGSQEALGAALKAHPELDFGHLVASLRPQVNRDALISLLPRAPGDLDLGPLIEDVIRAKNFGAAAYLIGCQGLWGPRVDDDVAAVSSYLSSRAYVGDERPYTVADYVLPGPATDALDHLGISPYLLLRNEIFARHGYVPGNPLLAKICLATTWYNPAFGVGAEALSPLERSNVIGLRTQEEAHDLATVGRWLDAKGYRGDSADYRDLADLQVPPAVAFSLAGLGINPSYLLRMELLARAGYADFEPKIRRLWSKTRWYRPSYRPLTMEALLSAEGPGGRYLPTNFAILQSREWLEIVDARKQTLPQGIEASPMLGLNTVYRRVLTTEAVPGEIFHLSSPSLAYVQQGAGLLKDREIGLPDDALAVSPETVARIAAASDPIDALRLYFEEMPYAGVLDRRVLRVADMAAPDYLGQALSEAKVTWPSLLRKAIHARHGAVFSDDTVAGRIFQHLSWYRPVFNLTASSPSRMPMAAKVGEVETLNFSLLEGEDLASLASQESGASVLAFDQGGSCYRVEFERWLSPADGNPVYCGYGYRQGESDAEGPQAKLEALSPEAEEVITEDYYEEGRCG